LFRSPPDVQHGGRMSAIVDKVGATWPGYAFSVMILAQETTTTTTLAPPDPERPLTDFVIDLFDLEEGSLTAGLLGQIIEPVLQIVFIVVVAWLASRFLRSEEHTSALQSRENLVCRLLLEKKN